MPTERVDRLPRRLAGKVVRLDDVPTRFPLSVAGMPEVRFGSRVSGVRLSYRPRETLHDGTGWSSETTALLQHDGTWARLNPSRLGIPADLWPGADPIGAGSLNVHGTRLALRAAEGLLVIDLKSGAFRHQFGQRGWIGGVRWHPDGRQLTADRQRREPDAIVDVTSGSVSGAAVPFPALGLLPSGEQVSVVRRGGHDVLTGHGKSGTAVMAQVPASPLMAGRSFESWSIRGLIAHGNRETVRSRHALRVVDLANGDAVGILTWSRRSGTWLRVHGWWDRERVLISMDRSLVTWNPRSGEMTRVAELPVSDVRREHAAVGISFPQR